MTTRPPYDDQPMAVPRHVWRHVAEWALLAGLAAWAGVSFREIPVLVLAGGLALTGVTVTVSVLRHTAYPPWAWYLAVWTLGLPAWTVAARRHGEYHWVIFATLAGPVLLLVVAGAHIWTNHLEELAAWAADEARKQAAAELARWTRMFAELGVSGVRAVLVEDTRAGQAVHLRLPASGRVKLARLQDLAENVAIACKLPPDAVTFERSGHAGEAVMHLDRQDILGEDLPFPAMDGWLTVTRPLPVGRRGDGEAVEALFREVQAMVIGATGSGKSNLLTVLIALLSRCEDVVVFVIDFKRGRLPAPWIRPWVAGRCQAPAVDWVATDRAEAEIMLRAVERLSESRMASLEGGSAITPSPARPQVIVLVDEASDIMGAGRPRREQMDAGATNTQMAEIGSRVTRKIRSEAMMMIWGTQRGVVSMTGSSDLKSQCLLRFALRCASEADAASVVPDDTRAQRILARLRHPGTGVAWLPGEGRPQPVKFYRLDSKLPADMAKILALAEEAGNHRAGFADDDLAALGQDYADRWKRSDLLERLRAQADADAGPPERREPEGGQRRVAVLDRQAEAAEFEQITAGVEITEPDEARRHPSWLRIHAYLAEMPTMGLSVLEMEARLRREPSGDMSVRRETIHRWMRRDIEAGVVESRHARYFLRRDRGQQ